MDNLSDILGTDPQAGTRIDHDRRELERKSQDTIRVKNILPERYVVRWDGRGHVVPGANEDIGFGVGQAVLPRYIAFKYAREMTNLVLNTKLQEAVKAENERRISVGMQEMTKWQGGEEQIFSDKFKPTNPELRAGIMSQLIIGLEKEWGLDEVVMNMEAPARKINPDQDVFEKLASRELSTPAENIPNVPQVTPDMSQTTAEPDSLINTI